MIWDYSIDWLKLITIVSAVSFGAGFWSYLGVRIARYILWKGKQDKNHDFPVSI